MFDLVCSSYLTKVILLLLLLLLFLSKTKKSDPKIWNSSVDRVSLNWTLKSQKYEKRLKESLYVSL